MWAFYVTVEIVKKRTVLYVIMVAILIASWCGFLVYRNWQLDKQSKAPPNVTHLHLSGENCDSKPGYECPQ